MTITPFGESFFNKKATFFNGTDFYGDITFDESANITFPTNASLNINKLSVNSVSVASSVTASYISVASSVTASSFIIPGGTSTQFLLANGDVTTPEQPGGIIPVGGIIMWSGTIANIPTGWALCNGSNGTPDLRNRFIVAAGTDTANVWGFNATTGAQTFTASQTSVGVNSTGGVVSHKLTIAELAAHTHTYTDRTNEGTGGGTGGGGANTGTTTLNKNTGSTGSDNYHENRPPYYALAFIMRTV